MSLKPRAENFDERWPNIKSVVTNVFSGKGVSSSQWNESFYDVYALCISYPNSLASRLYEEMKMLCDKFVESVLEELQSCNQEEFIFLYHSKWELYQAASSIINNLFGYLNMQYVKKKVNFECTFEKLEETYVDEVLEIEKLALRCWSTSLLSRIKEKLIELVLGEIHKDRLGHTVPTQHVIQRVIKSFIHAEIYKDKDQHTLYEESLEKPFLKQVNEYYKQKALELAGDKTVSEYVIKCLQLIDDEGLRSKKFMDGVSYDRVISAVQHWLVTGHLNFILSDCKNIIENQSNEDLKNIYRLLKFAPPAILRVVEEYQSYIQNICCTVINNLKGENMPTIFTESLVEIHENQSKLIKEVFQSDVQFITALDKGFNNVINKPCRDIYESNEKPTNTDESQKAKENRISQLPDLLVKYCDLLLKKGTKGLNENELDDKLSGAIIIFKYLGDKDVFNKSYSRYLGKRLIFLLSQSMDAEESMIKKLKQICGHEYTSKLHRMFTDVKISQDFTSKFLESLNTDIPVDLGLGFSILVMQAGAWPLTIPQTSSFTIPQELEKSLQTFEKFYQKNFNGRKLMWYHAFSTCDVKFNYLSKNYTVITSVYVMSVLVVFNNQDLATFSEISAHTCVANDELFRCLQLLVDNNLLFCDTNEQIRTDSKFSLNLDYQNKRQKFKLMQQVKETAQETERVINTITEDRKMFLQAVIVRTMKSRKKMKHRDLVEEILKQSSKHFVPTNSLIKKTIEQLIDKQYLERVSSSMEEYTYVA